MNRGAKLICLAAIRCAAVAAVAAVASTYPRLVPAANRSYDQLFRQWIEPMRTANTAERHRIAIRKARDAADTLRRDGRAGYSALRRAVALELEYTGRPHEALAEYDLVIRANESTAEVTAACYQKGRVTESTRDLRAAAACYRSALDAALKSPETAGPSPALAANNLNDILVMLGDPAGAIAVNTALIDGPLRASAEPSLVINAMVCNFNLARRSGDSRAALLWCERLLSEFPRYGRSGADAGKIVTMLVNRALLLDPDGSSDACIAELMHVWEDPELAQWPITLNAGYALVEACRKAGDSDLALQIASEVADRADALLGGEPANNDTRTKASIEETRSQMLWLVASLGPAQGRYFESLSALHRLSQTDSSPQRREALEYKQQEVLKFMARPTAP